MTLIKPTLTQPIYYSRRTFSRAERAVRCAPFRLHLFTTMGWQSVSLQSIKGKAGIEHQYTLKPLAELVAENHLVWLIQVGVLRREVDGQGLTDSFRLTPLGRQLVEKWNAQGGNWSAPSLLDHIYNFLSRWFKL